MTTETKSTESSTSRRVPVTNDWGWSVNNLHDQFNHLYGQISQAHEMFGTPLPRWRDIDPTHADESSLAGMTALPQTDVSESNDGFTIAVELPGMDDKDIDLNVKDGRLTISGEKTMEREKEENDYHIRERRFGSFRRSFRIPENVDDNSINADVAKGVLTITLPKKPTAASTARKIEITAT